MAQHQKYTRFLTLRTKRCQAWHSSGNRPYFAVLQSSLLLSPAPSPRMFSQTHFVTRRVIDFHEGAANE
nr:Hypothetical protein SC2p1_00800 [Methylocystis sp. SC2]